MSWMLLEVLKKVCGEKSDLPSYREPSDFERCKVRFCVEQLSETINQLIIPDEDLEVLFGKPEEKWLRPYPKFGERAWLYVGKAFDVVLWDEGNGWYTVLAILFKSQSLYEWLKEVY